MFMSHHDHTVGVYVSTGLVKCYCINGNEEDALTVGKALSKHLKNKAQSHFVSYVYVYACVVLQT